MREIVRKIAINSLSLFLVSLVFSGLKVKGGFQGFITGGAILSVLTLALDPIIKIITIPFNVLTLGFLSFLTTLVSLYLMSMFYSGVHLTAFTFEGLSFYGFEIKKIFMSGILLYVVISATIYFLGRALDWLLTK